MNQPQALRGLIKRDSYKDFNLDIQNVHAQLLAQSLTADTKIQT